METVGGLWLGWDHDRDNIFDLEVVVLESTIESLILTVGLVKVDLNVFVKVNVSVHNGISCLKLVLLILNINQLTLLLSILLEETNTGLGSSNIAGSILPLGLDDGSVLSIQKCTLLNGKVSQVLSQDPVLFLGSAGVYPETIATNTIQWMYKE